MYSRQTAVISTDPASGEELSSYAQQSYPSPEELHHQAMYGSLFASPTLYDRHELDNEQEFVQQLATPASLLHESPLFDETPWGGASSAVEEDLGGLERQLALERELGFDLGRDSGADARLWDTIHEPVGLETTSTTFSYSPEAFSLSLSDSTPLSSPPSALYDSAPPSPHVSAPFPSTIPPAPSAAFTALANKALECRRARAETTPGSPSTSNDIRRARSSSSQTASKKASSDPNKNNYSCGTCGITIAQLNLRGKGDCLNVPLVAEYWCLRCAPPPGGPGAPKDDAPPVRYEETLSGMLDEMQGVNSARSEDPLLRWRPRADKEERVLVCDVCKLLVGTGSLRAKDPDDEIDFGVEVVCSACSSTYSRCSDCGGGGGPRLGVGKWRSKELFAGGRKTCNLSHLRLGSLEEMTYDCWRVSDLPSSELEELVASCRELHCSTLLQTLATPDSLESSSAIANSYEQVRNLASDGWTMLEPLLRHGLGSTALKQRYIALRFSTPIPRKKARISRANAKRERNASANSSSGADLLSEGVLRPGKNIVGFVLGEVDLNNGSLCLPVIMPSGSVGDTYEATTTLLRHLSTRVYLDLSKENAARAGRKEPPLPPLREAWTMTMFTKDPRGVNHFETRRGFSSLEKYGLAHPHSDLSRFSLSGPGFIPPELTAGWQVFVRELQEDDDWSAGAKRKAGATRENRTDGIKNKKVKR